MNPTHDTRRLGPQLCLGVLGNLFAPPDASSEGDVGVRSVHSEEERLRVVLFL